MAPLSHPQGEWKSSQRYVSPPCENLTSTALPSDNTETPCWSSQVLLPNARATRRPPALWLVFCCVCRFTSIVRKATTNLKDRSHTVHVFTNQGSCSGREKRLKIFENRCFTPVTRNGALNQVVFHPPWWGFQITAFCASPQRPSNSELTSPRHINISQPRFAQLVPAIVKVQEVLLKIGIVEQTLWNSRTGQDDEMTNSPESCVEISEISRKEMKSDTVLRLKSLRTNNSCPFWDPSLWTNEQSNQAMKHGSLDPAIRRDSSPFWAVQELPPHARDWYEHLGLSTSKSSICYGQWQNVRVTPTQCQAHPCNTALTKRWLIIPY